jgi:hypothetical protein
MYNSIPWRLTTCFLSIFALFQSCVDDEAEYLAKQGQTEDHSFVESFDTVDAAYGRGWRFLNKSVEIGPTNWMNPSPNNLPFPAFYSVSTSRGYLWVDYNSTSSGQGIISNWAISPVVSMKNGDTISFYTRAELFPIGDDSTDFSNRLQVRMNIQNTGLDVGEGDNFGDFDKILLDINPTYLEFHYKDFINGNPTALLAYPYTWKRFEIILTGIDKPTAGRFAFRYFLEGGGGGGKGTSIGVDLVTYKSAK